VQRAEKKLFLDQMVNRNTSSDTAEGFKDADEEDVSSSEMLKALQFGAHAVFKAADNAEVSDQELDTIIDRSRTEDCSVGALQGGTSHDAAGFNAEQIAVSMRELEGEVYGGEKETTFQNCKSVSDIAGQWQELQNKQRERKSRVVNVDGHAVLTENNYTIEEGMTMERKGSSDGLERTNSRQIAGRDYDHESQCLRCWDGGDLVCCDCCPAAYHPQCLGLNSADEIPAFGTFACPHHSCSTCNRKSGAAGGLLFRCLMCPEAFL